MKRGRWVEHHPKAARTHKSQNVSRCIKESHWGHCLLGFEVQFLPWRRRLRSVSASSALLFHPCTCQSFGWAVSFQPWASGNKTAKQNEYMENLKCDFILRKHDCTWPVIENKGTCWCSPWKQQRRAPSGALISCISLGIKSMYRGWISLSEFGESEPVRHGDLLMKFWCSFI